MSRPAVSSHALVKRYGETVALDAFDLEVESGVIVGLVGPNGAGKSTFFKVILGLVHADGGEARVLGLDCRADSLAIRRRVAYLPGDLGFYANWTGLRWLEFMLAWHPRSDLALASSLGRDLSVPLDRKIKALSTGMRQKLGIVATLATGAELLLLDEPTRGLDPTSQARFLELLVSARRSGATIVLSSHALGEIERIADHCEFVDRGRRLPQSVIARVRAEFRRTLRVRPGSIPPAELRSIAGIVGVEADGGEFVLRLEGAPAEPVAELLRRGVESLEFNRPSLEDLYRRLYLDEARP